MAEMEYKQRGEKVENYQKDICHFFGYKEAI
jgi:hypothetical protein